MQNGKSALVEERAHYKRVTWGRLGGSVGCLGGSVVKHLPSVQVMIPVSWDRAPHQAPCSTGSLILPLPLPLLVFPLSRYLSLSNK